MFMFRNSPLTLYGELVNLFMPKQWFAESLLAMKLYQYKKLDFYNYILFLRF